ncbi:MAG TPA: helix-turn-helix domain-containing protein, partial [Thermoanaerobaculia bacterium]|nr:helix-turn-helix domain-containing protein [Thermoanaerobaculia bacterium]
LPETAAGGGGRELSGDFPTLEELESRYVARVLASTKGNFSKAAKILGVNRKTLYRMRDELSKNAPNGESWDIH